MTDKPRRTGPSHTIWRDGRFYYMRRVPKAFAHLDRRRFVKKSLGTDSAARAAELAAAEDRALEAYWRNLEALGDDEAGRRYAAARRLAAQAGFDYRPMADLVGGRIEELVARLEAVKARGLDQGGLDQGVPDRGGEAAALLGAVDPPALTLSAALARFWNYARDETRGKTDRELRRWKNPRRKAVANFIALKGDLALDEIGRGLALDFRDWWLEKIVDLDLTANAANKDIGHLSKIFRTVVDAERLDLVNPFERLRLSEAGDASTKTSFDTDYIAGVLLDPGRLDGLNGEARMLLYAMADTGAGFNELTGLDAGAGDIRLDADLPYIDIRPGRWRGIKTAYRARQIPLVGSALYAFRQFPEGFARYAGRPDSASNVVNKYLRERRLLPSEDHSANSLRHSVEDRLTALDPPDKLVASIMGHRYGRERYGKGPDLAQKKAWLDRIAFTVS